MAPAKLAILRQTWAAVKPWHPWSARRLGIADALSVHECGSGSSLPLDRSARPIDRGDGPLRSR